MRHASFFSGVGGLDLGFERAGITTVSVCEIDPYASAVLAERFPGAPNLGSITEVNAHEIPEAEIWSGGFPCQDLSVAGKRAGFAGKRSSLAFTYLDLVEQRRPRWLVLENVPGLFSSNQGRDFGRLIYEMEGLGYGVAWRTLDARFFGVAQRRRRVFIVASFGTDRAGEVLFECEGCNRHFAPSRQARQGATARVEDGLGIAGALTGRFGKGVGSTVDEPLIIGTPPNPVGNGAANGLARWVDDKQNVARKTSFGQYEMTQTAATLKSSGGDIGGGSENLAVWSFPSAFCSNATVTKDYAQSFAHSAGAPAVAMTLTAPSKGGRRNKIPTTLVDSAKRVMPENPDLYPAGLDSHRYRCCGNGVVAPVAQWIGERLMHVDRHWREEANNG